METITLVMKGASLAATAYKLYETMNIERLVNETKRKVENVSFQIFNQESTNLLDAVELLKQSEFASNENQAFYIEQAYLKFVHSFNYFKTIWNEILSFKKVEDGVMLFSKGGDETTQKKLELCWKNIRTAIDGCYICSYYLKNYRAALDYLDKLLEFDMSFLVSSIIKKMMECPDFDEHRPNMEVLTAITSPPKGSVFWEEGLSIMKNMVEISIDNNLTISKEQIHFILAYKNLEFEEIEEHYLYCDIKYIVDNKAVIDLS